MQGSGRWQHHHPISIMQFGQAEEAKAEGVPASRSGGSIGSDTWRSANGLICLHWMKAATILVR